MIHNLTNYHFHRMMADNKPSITNLLQIAAPYAIYKWVESEKRSVEEIQSCKQICVDTWSRWLTQWNLNRTNPRNTRENLATLLNEIRVKLEAEESDLPKRVMDGVKQLKEAHGISDCQQTSLVSKLAFSLRPDVAAPYDSRALRSLCRLSECSIGKLEHNYPAYLKEFDRLADAWGEEMDKTELTESLRPLWSPFMGEILFKRRTTDKLLWLMGGLVSVDGLALIGFIAKS